ncbi:erythromycin esterase family protein [Sphingomonas sp. LB-2]|uniref:erythromycin esterase family protein n=1 Tax=Sphingomonas caeni TaxID=2984949 RepID=UPI0022328369|nr:erythromycin esterase family protein [Sphingomonas caeni]MCW3846840.1 erythromycin esterase family protein [Sphingomonas caeni]
MLALALTLAAAAPADQPALSAAVADLCPRGVAMLGEGANHGDGRADAFRVALVRRLVDECGYGAILFEAGYYDFYGFSREFGRGNADPKLLGSAIGGLWNRSGDFQPLIPFLLDRMQAGRLTYISGIDDNLGSAGAFYSLDAMPKELAAYLPVGRRAECEMRMRRRIRWEYPASQPYDRAERLRVTRCLVEIRHRLPSDEIAVRHLVDNFRRFAARDFLDDAAAGGARDATMYWNFRWIARRLPKGTKVIVWAATVHLAKDARADPAFPEGGNFGSLLHRDYGERAFVLGFSALTGSVRQGRREIAVPPAPPGSIETLALNGPGEAAYMGPRALAAIGPVPGAIFRHHYVTARWADAVDGLVVFREERPPLPSS